MRVLLRAALAALLIVGAVRAEEPEGCPRQVALPDVLRCALRHSPKLAETRGEVQAARGRRSTADRLLTENPELRVGAGRRSIENGRTDLDRSVELAQRLELGGQRGARQTVAAAEERGASAGLDAARREVVADVAEAAVQVWGARRNLAVAAEQREAAGRLVDVAAARARQGVGASLDMDLAQAAQVEALRNELAAAADLRQAHAQLALVVGAAIGVRSCWRGRSLKLPAAGWISSAGRACPT